MKITEARGISQGWTLSLANRQAQSNVRHRGTSITQPLAGLGCGRWRDQRGTAAKQREGNLKQEKNKRKATIDQFDHRPKSQNRTDVPRAPSQIKDVPAQSPDRQPRDNARLGLSFPREKWIWIIPVTTGKVHRRTMGLRPYYILYILFS
jgi:hypothetical protein